MKYTKFTCSWGRIGNDKPGKGITQTASSVSLQSQYKSSFFTLIFFYLFIKVLSTQLHDKWVPVTTAWRVLRLRMEERPPIWRVAVNILNKQLQTADEGWSSSLGVGRGANNASPSKNLVKYYSHGEMLPLETKQSGGKLLHHSDLRWECF